MLPVGANLVQVNGNRKTVILSGPERNPALDDDALATLSIDEPAGEGWSKETHPYGQGRGR